MWPRLSEGEACQILKDGLASLNIEPLPAACLSQVWRYFIELSKWNRSINLVAKASDQDIIENHFLDSLTLLPEIQSGPVLDVGSGAGFPGLVLKIARPECGVTLVEPRQKRVSFLRHIIRTLGLTNITVTDTRLVTGDATFIKAHGQFPIITCRALTEIAPFLDLIENISPPQGLVLCMKGPRASEELNDWKAHAPESPFTLERSMTCNLPTSGAERKLVVFRKHSIRCHSNMEGAD